MGNINDLHDSPCSGCGVCAVVCPEKCITIDLSPFGFWLPNVDETRCVDCGECTNVCSKQLTVSVDITSPFEDKRVIAAIDENRQVLATVSSGGVANRLATDFLDKGYDVCGVVFDPHTDECRHAIAQDKNEVLRFRTSKFVQSYTLDALGALDKSKQNLVFGTPCQIFGLRQYLQREGIEDSCILVDFFCRGVPSLLLWRAYKDYVQRNFGLGDLAEVNFKDKSHGWHKFSMRMTDTDGKLYSRTVYEDLFYSFYLKNTCLNTACYGCLLRNEAVYSDIRLGDFWGEKHYHQDEGVSLVVLCTRAGAEAWQEISEFFCLEEASTQEIFASQRFNRLPMYDRRDELLRLLAQGERLERIHHLLGLDAQGFYRGGGK